MRKPIAMLLLATSLGACGARSSRYIARAPSVYVERTSGDDFHDHGVNPWVETAKDRWSTFAADVDTAAYTVMRRELTEGKLPPAASVRVEEYLNYFRYAFPPPSADSPFAVVMDAAPSPLASGRTLLRVGVGTRAKSAAERKPAHLVFLVDVSGSMSSADRLPLAQQALRILVDNLTAKDTVALVTYAGGSRVVLPPTGVSAAGGKAKILAAIDDLRADGSTAMASGIDLAYAQAMAGLEPGAISRVIVMTDGDANVGPTGHGAILKLIADRAEAGVTLTTVGFGLGNLKDHDLEQLADRGNGNALYVDSLSAAKKAFAEQLGANLEVVAKDVKLQVEFDPDVVTRYRLVGYENRDLADRDFRNDRVDAGEVGAGHQVTALYEVELAPGSPRPLGSVRVRYKAPDAHVDTAATERTFAMAAPPAPSFEAASPDLRFAAAVAMYADVLRGAPDAEGHSLAAIAQLARAAAGDDPDRRELVTLVERARQLHDGDAPTATVAR